MTDQEAILRELADAKRALKRAVEERDYARAQNKPLQAAAESTILRLQTTQAEARLYKSDRDEFERKLKWSEERYSALVRSNAASADRDEFERKLKWSEERYSALVRSNAASADRGGEWRIQRGEPTSFVKKPSPAQVEQIAQSVADKIIAASPPRARHTPECPRCLGPAYQGLGKLQCERVGGCAADAEPGPDDVYELDGRGSTDRESAWVARGALGSRFATRELASEAWKRVHLTQARGGR